MNGIEWDLTWLGLIGAGIFILAVIVSYAIAWPQRHTRVHHRVDVHRTWVRWDDEVDAASVFTHTES